MAREMKDSGVEWIGEIPREWEIRKIKYVAQLNPKIDTEYLEETSEVTFTPMEKIKNGYFINNKNFWGNNNSSYTNYSENDIVMAKVTPCFENGNIAIMKNLYNGVGFGSSELFVFRSKKNIRKEYLFYFLRNEMFKKLGKMSMTGAGGLKRVSSEFILNFKITIPPLEEQEKIANYLDKKVSDIDLIIEKTRTTIEDYKKYKQSIITEAVTKGVNPNVEMKDSGVEWIGEIPKEWEIDRLKNNFLLKKGLSITKENLKEYGVPVINYGQIHSKDNNGIEITKNLIRYVDESYLEKNLESLVEEGDFIFADTSEDLEGSGNNIYISNVEKLFAGYHTIILKSKIQKENKYLAYLFKTNCWRSQIRSRVTGIKLFSITQKILKEMTILLPPLEEQNQIAEYLDKKTTEIDTIIIKKEALIAELEEYKKSLIYECVTGKKEIK